MHVVIIGPAYPLKGGGLSTYNHRLAQEFQQHHHKVSIYTFSLQYPGFLFPGKTQYSTDAPPADLDIKVKINSINPFNWLSIGTELKHLKPDLIIIRYWLPLMGPCLGTIARIAKSNKHTKIISIVDNVIPHEKRPGDKIFSRYFVNGVDAFVTMSKAVLNDLLVFDKVKPKKFCLHPLYDNFGSLISQETAKEKLKLDKNFHYILFFGFIRDYKGLDILLEAFADKRLRSLALKLIVAGEFYSDSKPYYDSIEKNHLQEHVVLKTDFIPDNKVSEYFCAADMVVQPYKDATQSGVTQVAYHFNKPMIVTDVGGLAETVPHNKIGYVVKPNALDIANAILTFYSENKLKEFSANAALEKKKFSWEVMMNAIIELYNLTSTSIK